MRHANQYSTRDPRPLYWMLASMALCAYLNYRFQPVELYRPLVGEVKAIELPVKTIVEAPDDIQKTDYWLAKYVDKYFKTHYGRSRARATMGCLLNKESEHTFMTESDHHGDNGKAGGILQYWAGTWTGMRKIMLEKGLITEIGSRYNPEEAIETTVWALSDGRERNWGPINIGDCLSVKGAK